MLRFDNQVALITGSGRGLGAAYARLLAERGARVVVHDAGVELDGSGGDSRVADSVVDEITSRSGTAIACYENIASHAGCLSVVEKTLSHFGRLDILINNAAWLTSNSLETITPPFFEQVIAVDIAAPFWLAQAVFPIMQQQQYGRIVLTTSGRAMYMDYAKPELTCYAVGKLGQLGLMNPLAHIGAGHGIYVNAISPIAATRMFGSAVKAPPGVRVEQLRPEQVAPGVVFLVSRQCQFSGIILEAGNGHFSISLWQRSAGIHYHEVALTVEDIADQWEAITHIETVQGDI